MKRVLFGLIAAISCALLVAGCASVSAGNSVANNDVYELVILHTNDHHGAIESKDGLGGLALRSHYVKEVRSQNENVLLLDAGDINTGTAISNMFKAEPDIKAYNIMKYDAVTLGNHEFDNGQDLLEKQIKMAEFAWLSANVTRSNGKYLDKAYIIKDFKGFRVGVFGLTTLRTLTTSSPDKSLNFADEIETAKTMVDYLKNEKKADIIILLGHLGDSEETKGHTTSIDIAKAVSGIDLIVDGHTHTNMKEPKIVNGTPIVSAWEWGKAVGTCNLKIQNGKIIGFNWVPVSIRTDTMLSDEKMTSFLKTYTDKAAAELDKVIGKTAAEFVFGNKLTRYKEMPLGDMVCDGIVWYAREKHNQKIDFAITNGGGIRAALPAGNVTMRDISTVLPFDNYLYVLTLKGSDVIKLFDFIGTVNQGAGAFPQVSKEVSFVATYDSSGKNGKVSDVKINGKPIDENAMYKILTNDYMAGGGDGYVIFKSSIDTFNTSCTLRDAIIEYFKVLPSPVDPNSFETGRITVKGGVKTE
ncbi:MAG: bifunctional metallophosphatase/5'-nucleotidase [Treponema sp.]|jgi:5'-nucleotidase/UDP-sugar diphosphatase|nr:bifunctional metallophosphatase/5'-nucleotidase [Treponema sp.]